MILIFLFRCLFFGANNDDDEVKSDASNSPLGIITVPLYYLYFLKQNINERLRRK